MSNLNFINMKKLNFLLGFVLIAFVGFVTSCENDESAVGPLVGLIAGSGYIASDVTVSAGAPLAFVFEARKGDRNLSTFSITRDDIALQGWDEKDIPSSVNDVYRDTVIFNAPLNDGSYTYAFTVTDKGDLSVTVSVVITVEGPGDIDTYTAVLMGAQSNLDYGSYLDASAGVVYKQDGAETNPALIDIIYYYGVANLATLTAPDDVTVNGGSGNLTLATGLTTKNATRFKEGVGISSSEFDAISDDSDIVEISSITLSKVNELAVDDVIAFQTVDGRKGLIKISAIDTGADGTITIQVKIQQ